MKLNATTSLLTPKILLVPYSPHHVPQYHTWMQSPDLQKLTASEPLSLEEEYAMQESWREDGDKLTFITCLPLGRQGERKGEEEGLVVQGGLGDGDGRMIGDVNLFLSEDDGDEGRDGSGEKGVRQVIGEIEIMIAAPEARGKGYGKAILLTFLWYIITNTSGILYEYSKKGNASLKFLRVKIDAENQTSISLFEKVGFTKTSPKPNYFNEVELRLSRADAAALFKDMEEPIIALYKLPVK
ncbi:hypothetical protein FKW77_005317 [Venturia effusa]|uniref:N-acetyltransferase domain-containing protein n=1 Tax=Venturia effusa TaxID=50376 RepID=A0A517KWD1_9PEZI|nr:hypothetical protein FKW77_005317 [Venturia effusa]